MITWDWNYDKDSGFWKVVARLNDSDTAEMLPDYKPFPTCEGTGVSRSRNSALGFALEALVMDLREKSK